LGEQKKPQDNLKEYVTTQSSHKAKQKTLYRQKPNKFLVQMKASKQKSIMPLPHERYQGKLNLVLFVIACVVLAVFLILKLMGN
jgi:hypothetical protein